MNLFVSVSLCGNQQIGTALWEIALHHIGVLLTFPSKRGCSHLQITYTDIQCAIQCKNISYNYILLHIIRLICVIKFICITCRAIWYKIVYIQSLKNTSFTSKLIIKWMCDCVNCWKRRVTSHSSFVKPCDASSSFCFTSDPRFNVDRQQRLEV